MRALLPAAAAIVFAADQASKWAVLTLMELPSRGVIELAPPWLVLRMAWNRGINFGLFAGGSEAARWALVALSVAISAGVAVWALRRWRPWQVHLSAGVLIGGALGNALDRVRYGAVADFLNMSCCGIANPYAFNVADIAIFAGVVALALWPGGRDGDTP